MENNNSIINSLKRLERVGAENSRVTEKLKEAAMEVANIILDLCKEHLEFDQSSYNAINEGYFFSSYTLPEGLKFVRDNSDSTLYLMISEGYNEYNLHDYEIDNRISREHALKLSKFVNDGYLDKFADFLEKRKVNSEKALQALEKAKISS